MDILNKINLLTQRIATEFNSVNSKLGDLSSLTTVDKTNIVSSLNELKTDLVSLENEIIINDLLNSSTSYTWSITKIKSHVDFIIQGLFTNVPIEHDTLKKISDAIKALDGDLNSGSFVSYGSSDNKTELEKAQARENIDAVSSQDLGVVQTSLNNLISNVGNTNRDFVLDFNNALI